MPRMWEPSLEPPAKFLPNQPAQISIVLLEIPAIFRELAELVPAIATEDVHHLRYEGGQVSQRKVQQVRR